MLITFPVPTRIVVLWSVSVSISPVTWWVKTRWTVQYYTTTSSTKAHESCLYRRLSRLCPTHLSLLCDIVSSRDDHLHHYILWSMKFSITNPLQAPLHSFIFLCVVKMLRENLRVVVSRWIYGWLFTYFPSVWSTPILRFNHVDDPCDSASMITAIIAIDGWSQRHIRIPQTIVYRDVPRDVCRMWSDALLRIISDKGGCVRVVLAVRRTKIILIKIPHVCSLSFPITAIQLGQILRFIQMSPGSHSIVPYYLLTIDRQR